MNNPIKQERLHYLDAMRSVLMILGIVLHSANVFSDKDWAIQNATTSIFFSYLVDFIHLFRMPAFFIVSGFFCHMTLKKAGTYKFIKTRIPRIAIPLIVTAITLNTLQNILLTSYGTQAISYSEVEYWYKGLWVSHLWFLNCLLYYFSISVLIYTVSPNILNRVKISINIILNYTKGYFPILLPFVSIILIQISYIIPDFNNQFYDGYISESLKYSVYFIFGLVLGTNKQILNQFVKPKLLVVAISIACIIFLNQYVFEDIYLIKAALIYKTELSIWFSCILCFNIFSTVFNKQSKIFLYLANSSYSIYLFHHVLVIYFGIIIIELDTNIWIKFILLVFSTFITTNIIHYFFIRKFEILSRLFNGKRINE